MLLAIVFGAVAEQPGIAYYLQVMNNCTEAEID